MAERIAILGAGKMGEALLSGLLRSGRPAADLLFTERHPDRSKMLEERVFLRCELRELLSITRSSFNAKVGKCLQCYLIHHDRDDMGKCFSQKCKNLKAMCIEIAPVVDGAMSKPGNRMQGTYREAFPEDGEGEREGWER